MDHESVSEKDKLYAPAPLACICALSCGSSPAAPLVTSPDPPTRLVTRVTLASDLPDTALPTVRGGDVHTFTATAEGGTPPIEFRWIANGIVLRGWRTDMSFSWDGVTTADGLRAASGRMYFWVEPEASTASRRSAIRVGRFCTGLKRVGWLTVRRTYSSWAHERGVPGKVIAQLLVGFRIVHSSRWARAR